MPVNQEIIDYIRDARTVNMSDYDIVAQLGRAGWRDDIIREALVSPLATPRTIPTGPIIEVRRLTKRYGSFTAVDSISFEVMRGETFGILGPNGAGKTTTLEMIEGLKTITSGSVLVDGKDVATETHAVKSVIGVQLQASSFFEQLTLREILELFASLYGQSVDPLALLADVQLTEKAKNQVKELSGGQKQRFSIAVAHVNNPKVLFLDEPTTGLDPQARRNLWDLVSEIKKRGTTIVITTHYMDEAEVLCNRIAIMDNARIVALDTTENLLKGMGTVSTIEFRATGPEDTEPYRTLPGVESVFVENGTYMVTTKDAQRTLDALFSMARLRGVAVDELRLKRATLEDVFLKLTGHQLRD